MSTERAVSPWTLRWRRFRRHRAGMGSLFVITLLLVWQCYVHAGIVVVLLDSQFILMGKLLLDPKARAPWYNATGTTLYVLGMLASAFALHSLIGGAG